MLAGPFLFSKSGVLKKKAVSRAPSNHVRGSIKLKRHLWSEIYSENSNSGNLAISVFPNFRINSQKFGNFRFPEILVTIRKMKRRVYMPSTGHVTRLFPTTAAALRARQPGAAAQKRNRRTAAARRLETERERERIRTVRRRVYVL